MVQALAAGAVQRPAAGRAAGRTPDFGRDALMDNAPMRVSCLILVMLLVVVQAELWFGKGGFPRTMALRRQVLSQQALNAQAQARNEQMQAELNDLREGLEMVEEKARTELGMIKPDEIYVQLTPANTSASAVRAPVTGVRSPAAPAASRP